MEITHIRNATSIINYANQRILVDPFFAPKHVFPPFAGISKNPTVDLPITVEAILDGITGVLVTHLHADHFDPSAKSAIDKSLPIFCQPDNDTPIKEADFTDVTVVTESSVTWNNITLTRVGGHHGLGAIENDMGVVSGFILQSEGEPIVYIAGDTVMRDEVREAVVQYTPDVIILSSGGAMWSNPDNRDEKVYILMDATEAIELAQLTPDAKIVVNHLEALDHCTVTREALRSASDKAGISAERLIIPVDGETVTL